MGITSVLLIAFFQQRPAPVENGSSRLRGVSRLRHRIAGGRFRHASLGGNRVVCRRLAEADRERSATIVCLLLLLAAAGKAAQVPFSGWLPRAMEGPTPSSAIFYGAISIHAGAYLLLRVQPLLAQSGWPRLGDRDRRGYGHLRHDRPAAPAPTPKLRSRSPR